MNSLVFTAGSDPLVFLQPSGFWVVKVPNTKFYQNSNFERLYFRDATDPDPDPDPDPGSHTWKSTCSCH